MEVLSGHLKNIRVPCGQDNVYKDECVYSYDTPVSLRYSFFYNAPFFFGHDEKKTTNQKNSSVRFHILRTKKKI